jgi:hypothetical protein
MAALRAPSTPTVAVKHAGPIHATLADWGPKMPAPPPHVQSTHYRSLLLRLRRRCASNECPPNKLCTIGILVHTESSYGDSFFYGCLDKNGYSAKVDNRILPVIYLSL